MPSSAAHRQSGWRSAIDDRAAVASFDHAPGAMFTAEKHAAQIDSMCPIPNLDVEHDDRRILANELNRCACVQHVEAIISALHFAERCLDARLARHIGRQTNGSVS